MTAAKRGRAPARTQRPIAEELPELLAARKMSLRDLAKALNLSASYLSRVLRGADGKRLPIGLVERIAGVLGVPPDYFLEFRLAAVKAHLAGRLDADAAFVDAEYDRIATPRRSRSRGA